MSYSLFLHYCGSIVPTVLELHWTATNGEMAEHKAKLQGGCKPLQELTILQIIRGNSLTSR